MSADVFWNLTWYDFGLWCLRIKELFRQRLEDHELHKGTTRSLMTMYANAHLPKGRQEYVPTDFYILSTDDISQVRQPREKEDNNVWEEKMRERFKRKGI